MLTQLKNWWNKDKIAIHNALATLDADRAATAKELATLKATLDVKTQATAEMEAELAIFRQKEAADAAKYDSVEPWVEIKSSHVDPVKGIQIQLDWNEAFIQYLKDNGIKGRDEESIVQKWLGFLYGDVLERMEEQTIEKSDQPRANEFE